MVTTRGKNIKLHLDSSEGELDRERDDEGAVEPPPKRQRTRQSKSSKRDPAFNPGGSSGKGKEKATSDQNHLITRRGGKGGKLRDLMNMPVDIFTEVCSYLDPHDLRRLALTSKRLWGILMTKEAKPIWKTAIASVPGLPECPTDLNEPQYFGVVYVFTQPVCPLTQGCTSRGTKVDWFHRVRFCAVCNAEKMTSDYAFSYRSDSLNIGLGYHTLSTLMQYFDSSIIMSSANRRSNSRSRGWMQKTDEPYYYIDAIKKAGQEYKTLPQEDANDYLSRLNEMRAYRIKTGTAMLNWKHSQLASRADDIAAEKIARFESIKIRLLDMGWDEKDFPISEKEFRDLVLKDQKLTPKSELQCRYKYQKFSNYGLSVVVWQNIKPKLELLLETSRNNRLEMERQQRRRSRETDISKFYEKLGPEVFDLPFKDYELACLLPELDKVFALPSIKSLLEIDVETVTEEQWIEVAPDARLFVLRSWRDCLNQLTAYLEDGATAPVDKTKQRTEATKPNMETEEAVSTSIERLQSKLSRATAVFSCESCYPTRITRFPDAIMHHFSSHFCYDMDGILNALRPLQPQGQDLVKRLLKDLKLDPDTAKSDPPVKNENEKNLLCTLCDERVAKYMSFDEMIDHFLGAQTWFDNATEAVRKSPDYCYPSRTVRSELPTIINDHDWASRDALLVRRDDKETKEGVLKLQDSFRKQGLNDPLFDVKGIGGEDLEKNPWREVTRCCRLCPKGYGPNTWQGTGFGKGHDVGKVLSAFHGPCTGNGNEGPRTDRVWSSEFNGNEPQISACPQPSTTSVTKR
ncbi:hypothetical protein FS837_004835 [Tulasnella sp. UAMH 9824]|nr:hypothetical protein FS837_004835 [Tulasnella sp. UAMH 9824]